MVRAEVLAMDKATVLKELDGGFNALLASVNKLDEAALSRRFYGDWNVKDILAHIAGWHRQMTGAMERMARGEKPTPEGVDYSDADKWNAGFASAMRAQAGTTVLAELQQSFANYRRAASAIPDERFGEGKTVNRLLETSGYGHYKEHLPAIEDYAKSAAA
jgi:hypothetical protein